MQVNVWSMTKDALLDKIEVYYKDEMEVRLNISSVLNMLK